MAPAPATAAEPVRFDCTGGPQTYVVPSDVASVHVRLAGASGGTSESDGLGGLVESTIGVEPGADLTIEVGCDDGYNGGGGTLYMGGGASDLRIGGASLSNRAVVAGGGGSAGYWVGAVGGAGGVVALAGADAVDANGTRVRGGAGGTAVAGGQSGGYSAMACVLENASPGALGVGGRGGRAFAARGGGGGGGYYGGGGGGVNCTVGAGGGGGSSYGPPGSVFTTGANLGHGFVEIMPLPTPGPAVPAAEPVSDDCANGTQVVTGSTGSQDFAATGFVDVRAISPDPSTTWVCVRAYTHASRLGGKFVVTAPAGGITGIPGADADHTACSSTPGNTVPGSHPALSGAVGDPGDPPAYLPYLLDAYSSATGTWVCLGIGDVHARVTVPTGVTLTPATVAFVADPPGAAIPEPSPSPSTPSGTCRPDAFRAADFVAASSRVYLNVGQDLANPRLCVRVEGPVTAGGLLAVDGSNAPGFVPAVETSTTDMSPCTVQVLHNDSPLVDVRRSATGAFPASICVTSGADQVRVTVSAGNGGAPASVTWTPDPGTPGLP